MSLATRLVLGMLLVVVVVMTAYGVTSIRQREHLIGSALAREAEAVASALQIVANGALREAQLPTLHRALERISGDPEVVVAAVMAEGQVVAGRPARLPACLDSLWRAGGAPVELHVWAECPERVRLVVLPLNEPAEALVLARSTEVVRRDEAASRRRIVLTTLALALLATAAILVLLRLALTRPLGMVMEGVRTMGGPLPPRPVAPPRGARELRELALAFNEMVERLEGKRRTLVRETEERVELERRLRSAETFAALGRLTGGVAHELGSPLGVIRIRAEAIEADPEAPPAARRHAATISAEVERIAGLVRDLLHVAGRHGPAHDRVELVPVLRDLADEFRDAAARASATLELELPPHPVAVRGDATLLRHAVRNLVDNAVQALAAHPAPRRLRLALARHGELARVVVEDTGPGISAEHLPYVFQPFYTTKDVGDGTGLGLAIALGIVEQHGGTLTLLPAAGGGVRAHLDLPAE